MMPNTHKSSPQLRKDDFGARLFHVVRKDRVPLHDPVAKHACGEFDEREHQHQRIEENFLKQVERRVLLVHVTGRCVMRVEVQESRRPRACR